MPEPGVGLIYQDPGFLDIQNLNFEYSDESPCIDAGNPNQYGVSIVTSISNTGEKGPLLLKISKNKKVESKKFASKILNIV